MSKLNKPPSFVLLQLVLASDSFVSVHSVLWADSVHQKLEWCSKSMEGIHYEPLLSAGTGCTACELRGQWPARWVLYGNHVALHTEKKHTWNETSCKSKTDRQTVLLDLFLHYYIDSVLNTTLVCNHKLSLLCFSQQAFCVFHIFFVF